MTDMIDNSKKYKELSEKYPNFLYDSYKIEEDNENIYITFKFEIEGLTTFNPTLTIKKKNYIKESIINNNIVKNLVFNIGLVELISYWKSTFSKNIIIKAGHINEDQIKWFKKLYYLGLGELRYTNNIEIFKKLTKKLPECHFVCISGKNPELYNMFKKAIEEENIENTTLINYTTSISKLMKISSGIFSKPGGLTTSEALSQGLPMFMINPLPGQEVANQNYIENIGAGILINKENLDMLIDRLKTDENYLKRLSENAKKFGKPNAADNICKIIFDLN